MRHENVIIPLLLVLLLFPLNMLFPFFGSTAAAPNNSISIEADGTVQGSSNIIGIGGVYMFVGDVKGPLIVKKDNIVIDGGGHKFTVDYGVGIVLANRHSVTLKNTHIEDVGGYNIDLTNATDCLIVGNTIVGAPSPTLGPIAIKFLHSQRITVKDNTVTNFFEALSLDWSSDHTITGNTLTNGILGISIQSSSGCTFRNNHLANCTFSLRTFSDYAYENDLDTSNTVDGKPIYYWVNEKDQTVPSDGVYVVLVNCTNIRVDGGSPQGISLISTTSSAITNVRMSGRGDGITLLDCSNIGITNNVLLDHAIGIQLHRSQNNQILANEISNHPTRGITLSNATNNLISGNTIFNNSYAIGPYQEFPSYANIIKSNNFTANDFAITANGDLTITGNTFEANDQAILFSGGSGCTITENNFVNNTCALYFGGSSGNRIYLNNFLRNDRQVTDGGVSSTLASPTNTQSDTVSLQLVSTHVNSINFMPPPPPSINQYDNGVKGNYWIDYEGHDSNGDGVGDAPFVLYPNNQDNHPLMSAVSIPPPPTLPPLTNPPSLSTNTIQATDDVSTGDLDPMMVTVLFILALLLVAATLLFYYKKHTP